MTARMDPKDWEWIQESIAMLRAHFASVDSVEVDREKGEVKLVYDLAEFGEEADE